MTRQQTKRRKTWFDAQDGEGNTHRLDVLITISYVEQLSGREEHEVRASITASDGRRVCRLKKGKYAIGATGEILTSDDLQAP